MHKPVTMKPVHRFGQSRQSPLFQTSALYVSIAVAVLLAGCAVAGEKPGEFDTPAVAPVTPEQRQSLRTLSAEAGPEERASLDDVIAKAHSVAGDPARPIEVIHYEGIVHTDPRRISTVENLNQMRDLAWVLRGWQLNDDPALAQTLREWITAWASTYKVTGNEVNEAKFLPLLVAYEALRDSFDDDEQDATDRWVRAMGEHHRGRVVNSDYLTNRYTKHLAITTHAARILGEDAWTQDVKRGIERMIRESLYADGTSKDLVQRDTLTYHGSALRVLIELLLLMPEQEGEALYDWVSPTGGSIRQSVDYMMPYVRGEKTREEWRNSEEQLDRERAASGLEEYRAGRLFEPRSAIEVMELASFYDPSIRPVVEGLRVQEGQPAVSWRLLLNDAMRGETVSAGE